MNGFPPPLEQPAVTSSSDPIHNLRAGVLDAPRDKARDKASAQSADLGAAQSSAQACAQSRALSRCLDLPVLGGNRVTVLGDGASAYAEIFAAIEQASDHVNVESGLFDLGTQADELVARLLARCRAQVRVNVLFERAGQRAGVPAGQLERLRGGGAKLCAFDPTHHVAAWWTTIEPPRDARRLVVVDGRLAFLGGLASLAHASRAADRLVRIEGPVVAELQWLFVDHWDRVAIAPMTVAHYFPPLAWVGSHRVGVAASSPGDATSPLRRALLGAIEAARQRVLLVGEPNLPARAVQRALAAASGRGVEVHLMWSSWQHGALARWQARTDAQVLARAGVQVHELHDAPLQVRSSVIDGVWSCIGAVGDGPVEQRGGDTTLIVLDASVGAQAEAAFQSQLARCRHAATRGAAEQATQATGWPHDGSADSLRRRVNARLSRVPESQP
jgi:cardiolipin synthase